MGRGVMCVFTYKDKEFFWVASGFPKERKKEIK
jgi:hypothetical protein